MAFQSANSSGSGKLLAEELTEKLKQRNAAITAESVADLMNRYMTKECHVEILMDFGGFRMGGTGDFFAARWG